jgi:hypothetical protein
LVAGSLGISSLVCLLNNGDHGQTDTTANLMGPFWRMDSPVTANGDSIVRSPTTGAPIFVNGWVRDNQGRPVEGAEVDVWHTSAEGFYENQDPGQADMNLRGKFESDVQFGVTRALIGQYVVHADEPAPGGDVSGPWYSLDHHFVIEPGEAKLPKPPITGKASGDRPTLQVLERKA